MRIPRVSWIIACLILSQPVISIAVKNKLPPNDRSLIDLSLEDAGLEFQRLRETKGHFTGGTWSDQLDKWMGKKHRLMLHLQSVLISNQADRDKIVSIMGKPDYSFQSSDAGTPEVYLHTLTKELKQVEDEVLIYNWRGSHDYLYFITRNGQLLKSDWWMARE